MCIRDRRRLLRRAARHGRLLGIKEPFLADVCETVIEVNESAYPVLAEKRAFIKKVIRKEEESFGKTIDTGLILLDRMIASGTGSTMSGEDAFKLSDTYGFPLDPVSYTHLDVYKRQTFMISSS